MAPPSLHLSGRLYEWEAASHPDDVPLAPLPDWLRALGEAHASGSTAAGVALPAVLPLVQLQDLTVSHRVKFLIQTGTDPDKAMRYQSRSEALFAVLGALVDAGYDDATMAGVVMDRRYGISAKVWEQKNPKSPRYEDQTRGWVAGEIDRARAKARTPMHDRTVPDLTQDLHQPDQHPQDTRPVIRLGPDITRMVDEGQAALLALPDGPVIFQRARRLSMIARGVTPPK